MSRPARATARPSLPVSSARPVTVSGAAALVSPFAAGLLVLGLLFKNSPELLRSGTTVLFVLLPSWARRPSTTSCSPFHS